ncbi:hypothetical protein B0T16DRAFT_447697 [Cercophora newfieldiana]|uniref:Nephrocystin 3-like N-terminal domain-containing protein n=1 Tax=Cercophora newfieldiana TaxID=92897 RepID=A0AA39Y2U2_9PEZI|nr:hypothetical protein B0T16DRAFT_447697 [Cercophora newfieldiana]
MDPVSAISVAAGIIDFSWNLVTGAKELHDSGRKTTKENARIQSVIDDLYKYSLDLERGGTGGSLHEKQLSDLAKGCSVVAKELLDILYRLRKTKNSRWQSLKTTWAGMRKQSDIADIERRLGEYRAQMNMKLLAILCEKQSSVQVKLDTIQSRAEDLSSSSAGDLARLRGDVAEILNAVKHNRTDPGNSSSRESESDSGSESVTDEDIPEDSNALFHSIDEVLARLARLQKAASSTLKETRILQYLHFNYIRAREKSINAGSDGTFEWILAPKDEFQSFANSVSSDKAFRNFNKEALDPRLRRMNNARRKLRGWLQGQHGSFHISGRAGSGKSTLMKFLIDNARVNALLSNWAGERRLILASYFFWRSDGLRLQMSLDGFYRSILFTVLRKCPHLIPQVFPDQWQSMGSTSEVIEASFELELFDTSSVEKAYKALIKTPMVQPGGYAFCFFIDGLDEHDARPLDRKLFARQLLDWSHASSNIKVCVSSRPEIEFQDVFPQDSRIDLHLLTPYDIFRASQSKFEGSDVFSRIEGFYLDLVRMVVEMAEGVFLWARLAVDSLIETAWVSADRRSLERKLEETPPELEKVFERMLEPLSRSQRRMLNYYFLLMLHNPFPQPLNALCLLWVKGLDESALGLPGVGGYSDSTVLDQVAIVQRHLQVLSKGLLVLEPDYPLQWPSIAFNPIFSHRVRFFHRSAVDYIDTAARRDEFVRDHPSFEPQRAHFLLRMAEIASVNLWNVPSIQDFEMYGLEVMLMKDDKDKLYQHQHSHLKLMEGIWARSGWINVVSTLGSLVGSNGFR